MTSNCGEYLLRSDNTEGMALDKKTLRWGNHKQVNEVGTQEVTHTRMENIRISISFAAECSKVGHQEGL